MSLRRFFVTPEAIAGNTFTITGADAKHIASVLRMGRGDQIELVVGDGRSCTATIVSASPFQITGEIVSTSICSNEPEVLISLIQCLPKGDKMDLVVQKCVEIGVTSIVPAISDRTVVRLQTERAQKKAARWRRIAEEACKQCGRSSLPTISDVISFEDAVRSAPPDSLKLIPYELESERSLKQQLEKSDPTSVVVCIGPEGGFSQDEVSFAESHGFIPVTLGNRILRTETAGLVVAACILYHMDELG
ncbi:MAG TPA: 16S rRNA (uracil(1498)-N(3))-methyltransferase [Bacillota bacterium]|nr:16S rRNA (uracil(1498)-N(3))-methyltransferase [Bacillota bacterium]